MNIQINLGFKVQFFGSKWAKLQILKSESTTEGSLNAGLGIQTEYHTKYP